MQVRRKRKATPRTPVAHAPEPDVAIPVDQQPLTTARATQYQDWVERMRTKRERNQQRIRSEGDHEPTPTYWRSEDVFGDDDLVAEAKVSFTHPVVQQMLATLGLAGTPTSREIEAAYRQLAKQHHPDRHVDSDEATRGHHLDEMRRVNEAYAQLRRLELS